MSIEIVHQPWFPAVALGAFAILLAAALGTFRPRSVLGPPRLTRDDPLLRLWMIPPLTLAIGLFVQSAYVLTLHRGELSALEQSPEARKAWKLPPRDEIILDALTPAVWIATMLWADRKLLGGIAGRLGLRGKLIGAGVGIGIVGSFVAVPLTAAASDACQWLSIHSHVAQPQEHPLLLLLQDQRMPVLRVLAVLAAVVLAPMGEEMLFRGHLQSALAQTFRALLKQEDSPAARWLAIAGASAAFAAVHFNGAGSLWMLPPLFLLAVCFGYVYERTGNLWASIVMHAMFNGTSIVFALWSMRG